MGAVAFERVSLTSQFAVGGMTCGSCTRHVEAAVLAVPGVRSAQVNLATAAATIEYDPATTTINALRQAVSAAGYTLETALPRHQTRRRWRPFVFGLLAALGLLAFYLGVITFAQGWEHALQQLVEDRWFVGAIAAGFGTQMGLFTYLRGLHTSAPAGGVAASTGTSTTAMLACCAHHLTEILPILGLSGAAVFLNLYKAPLLWLGIVMNLVGATYLLRQIRRQQQMTCHPVSGGKD